MLRKTKAQMQREIDNLRAIRDEQSHLLASQRSASQAQAEEMYKAGIVNVVAKRLYVARAQAMAARAFDRNTEWVLAPMSAEELTVLRQELESLGALSGQATSTLALARD